MAELNILEAIRTAMDEELERDPNVMVLGEDVGKKGGVFGATEGLFAKYGEKRVLDTPLTEGMIAGAAAGAAIYGLRPIAEMQFADFVYPAFNQIVSEISRMRYRSNGAFGLPMVIRMPYGGGVHGALYHSQSNEAYFTSTVGLKVVAPGHAGRRQGPAQGRGPRPGPGHVLRAQEDVPPLQGGGARRRPRGAHRLGGGRPRRARTCRSSATATCAPAPWRRPRRWPARTASRRRSSTCGPCARWTPPPWRHRWSAPARRWSSTRRTDSAASAPRSRPGSREECFEHLDGPVTRLAGPEVPGVPFHHVLEDWFMLDPAKIVDAARTLAAY